MQGVFLEQGCALNALLRRIGNTVIWATFDTDGTGIVVMANGYTPQRVSTFGVETLLAQPATNGHAWTYQEVGHWFCSFHMEGRDDATPVFDLTMDRWHERGLWVEADQEWLPNRPISHCFCFGKHLVGDRLTGTVYEQSSTLFDQELATT